MLASELFLTAFGCSWRYFVVRGPLIHALMLVFLAATAGLIAVSP